MKNRKLLIILTIILMFVTVYVIKDTYALFESNKIVNTNTNIAKWNVMINGKNINNEQRFIIDSINILEKGNVKNGKMAPGAEGYFDIVIEPNDTDTSIIYNVTFDFTKVNGSFKINKIEEITSGNLIMTGESIYSKVITLDEIKRGVTNTIRVYIKWDNIEENNEEDSQIGLTKNNFINIPVIVEVTQYLGEEILEYQNE